MKPIGINYHRVRAVAPIWWHDGPLLQLRCTEPDQGLEEPDADVVMVLVYTPTNDQYYRLYDAHWQGDRWCVAATYSPYIVLVGTADPELQAFTLVELMDSYPLERARMFGLGSA